MAEWKVGDVVRLKSGGPYMTVSNVSKELITCVWFEKQVKNDAAFDPAMLESKADIDKRSEENMRRASEQLNGGGWMAR